MLRLHAPNAGSMGLIPGPGAKIPHSTSMPEKRKREGQREIPAIMYKINKHQGYIVKYREI